MIPYAYAHSYTHINSQTYRHTHTDTHTHIHTHTYAERYTCTYRHTCTYLVRNVVRHLDGIDFVEVKLNTLDDLELGPSIPDSKHA